MQNELHSTLLKNINTYRTEMNILHQQLARCHIQEIKQNIYLITLMMQVTKPCIGGNKKRKNLEYKETCMGLSFHLECSRSWLSRSIQIILCIRSLREIYKYGKNNSKGSMGNCSKLFFSLFFF